MNDEFQQDGEIFRSIENRWDKTSAHIINNIIEYNEEAVI